jgi:hypothetical protein
MISVNGEQSGRKKRHHCPPESPESDLEEGEIQFITISHPAQLQSKSAQKIIRKHVMGEVGKAKRRLHRKFENPSSRTSSEAVEQTKIAPFSFSWLGAGDVDPFVKYPIELDASSRALVANSECIHLILLSKFYLVSSAVLRPIVHHLPI